MESKPDLAARRAMENELAAAEARGEARGREKGIRDVASIIGRLQSLSSDVGQRNTASLLYNRALALLPAPSKEAKR